MWKFWYFCHWSVGSIDDIFLAPVSFSTLTSCKGKTLGVQPKCDQKTLLICSSLEHRGHLGHQQSVNLFLLVCTPWPVNTLYPAAVHCPSLTIQGSARRRRYLHNECLLFYRLAFKRTKYCELEPFILNNYRPISS